MTMSYDQYVARASFSLGFAYDRPVELLTDVLNKTVQPLGNVFGAPEGTSALLPTVLQQRNLGHLLAPRTAIFPNVPMLAQPLAAPNLSDLLRRNALVVTIIPLSDVFRHFDIGDTFLLAHACFAVRFPGQRNLVSNVEQLKGTLRALSRRDISAIFVTSSSDTP